MTTQQHRLVGYAALAPEELQAIVRRAHYERKQAMREFFTWLFGRRKAASEAPRRLAHMKVAACR